MKRSLESSDSLGAFMSICPTTTDEQISPRPNFIYSGVQEFPSMLDGLDEEGCLEEFGHVAEKKRRLRVDQVKALEKNFEVDNKLEPERKVKLAQELGLQPRQVAVWFQNRRARWKTKQLERDYGVLKANYDALQQSHDELQRDNESLLKEIRELKAKLNEEETTSLSIFVVEEVDVTAPPATAKETVEQSTLSPPPPPHLPLDTASDLNYETFDIFPTDSDSSAVLNEDNSPTAVVAAAAASAIPMGCFGQFVKMEEHGDLFSGEEACKLFAADEQWCSSDRWN